MQNIRNWKLCPVLRGRKWCSFACKVDFFKYFLKYYLRYVQKWTVYSNRVLRYSIFWKMKHVALSTTEQSAVKRQKLFIIVKDENSKACMAAKRYNAELWRVVLSIRPVRLLRNWYHFVRLDVIYPIASRNLPKKIICLAKSRHFYHFWDYFRPFPTILWRRKTQHMFIRVQKRW